MCQWIRRLFGLARIPEPPQVPKRRTALQRLNPTCARAMIDHERQAEAGERSQEALQHGNDPRPKRKPA
jgi:hypothetical protein